MNRIMGSSKNTKKILFSNSNIYNWENLNKKYYIKATNQDKFLEKFLKTYNTNHIDKLEGSYSIAYTQKNKIILIRDIVGIKPLCYCEQNNELYFASELKDLPEQGKELNPREYIIYDKSTKKLEILKRKKYYKSKPTCKDDYETTKTKIKQLFTKAIKKQTKNAKKIGILFSGGTDSTLIALTLQTLKIDFTCYTASIKGGNIREGKDIYYARKIAKECNFKWKLAEINFNDVPEFTKKIMKIIASKDYTKVSVALPLALALEKAKQDKIDFMFTGIGSEEIFADYKRAIDVKDINKTCIEGLKSLWIRDLYRDDTLATYNNIELKFPFLENKLVNYSIKINPKHKINKEKGINKLIIRDILRDFKLNEEFVTRPKKAAQYGSKSDRIFEKLSKQQKQLKQEYLEKL